MQPLFIGSYEIAKKSLGVRMPLRFTNKNNCFSMGNPKIIEEAKEKEISRLNTILEKALCWFPLLKEMLRMEKLCYVIGFTTGMVDSLLYKKEALRCSGKIYSEEYRQRFETKNVIFKIERSPIDKNKLMLTINQQPISEWFKEQWEKLQQHLRNSVQKEQKSRGFRM